MPELDPRIELVRKKYDLDATAFWKLPQGKDTWLVKHAALEIVAAKAGIIFEPPTILEAKGEVGVAAVCVTGHMGDKSLWSIGESNPKNTKTSYPWAIAEKRAIDRVILKLIGIHGLVYSEDEMSDVPETPKTLVKDQRVIDGDLRAEINACLTVEDLERLWKSTLFQTEFKKIKPDWQEMLIEHFKEHKELLVKRPVHQSVAPNFEGMPQ